MAQEARIVVDLLERHSRVPSREEILARYVRAYKGRPIGTAAMVAGHEVVEGPAVPSTYAFVEETGEAMGVALEPKVEEAAPQVSTEPAGEPEGDEGLQTTEVPSAFEDASDDAPVDEPGSGDEAQGVEVSGREPSGRRRKKRRHR